MKRRVFAIGEALLDIIFENDQPVQAVAGGSMVNVAVSLGRAGVDTQLISEFGNDPVGKIIHSFLVKNNVQCSFSHRYTANNTSVAMAFLDGKKNASYTFYHDIPAKIPEMPIPGFTAKDIVLCGSYYSIKKERNSHVWRLLHAAREAGALTLFDPNIRKGHHENKEEFMKPLINNIRMARV
jgi:fructokinase